MVDAINLANTLHVHHLFVNKKHDHEQVTEMKTPLDGLQCAVRIMLGCCLAFTATEHLMLTTGKNPVLLASDEMHLYAGWALSVLMVMTSIWLAFGYRTRVMALLGASLYGGMVVLLPGLPEVTSQTLVSVAVVAALALPLIFAGGGRFSLLRAGWQVPL